MYKNFRTSQEFISEYEDYCEKQCITSLKYGGSQDLNMYTIDYAENEFILPEVNDRIIGVHWTDLSHRGIRLPEDMYMFGSSYDNTFEGALVLGSSVDNKLTFGSEYTSVNYMFCNAEFHYLHGELTIFDSILDINSMFYYSKGLHHVTFKNCELSSLVGLTQNSDVECVTFENCSLVVTDNSHLNSWGQKLEAGCLDEIFGRKTTTVNSTGCDDSLIEELIKLNSRVQQFVRELEINILD